MRWPSLKKTHHNALCGNDDGEVIVRVRRFCDKSWGISHVCVRLSHTADHYGAAQVLFYETWQKFTHITHRKKIQGWENRVSSVWPINAIVAKTIDGFFNRCPLMRSNAQTLQYSNAARLSGDRSTYFYEGDVFLLCPWY